MYTFFNAIHHQLMPRLHGKKHPKHIHTFINSAID